MAVIAFDIKKQRGDVPVWRNEAGQLSAMVDNKHCGYYGYDANGERGYKLTGQSVQDQYNAETKQYHANFNDEVLYANLYFVVTPTGYTKHYYNGSQRIAARLGDYWNNDMGIYYGYSLLDTARVAMEKELNIDEPIEEVFDDELLQSIDGEELSSEPFVLGIYNMMYYMPTDMLSDVLYGQKRLADDMWGVENGVYFYHPDHLGSSSWITDDQGHIAQYIHYMPYGEIWRVKQESAYNERFRFTGKERDTESGYDYFGARYYSSMLGHWLSVDKLADDYPHITPYAQSAWNPIKYVDTDGMDYTVAVDGDTKTITIQATYYTNSDDYESAEVAAEFWNKNSGKYSYTEKKETYTINFDLKVEDGHDNLGADRSAQSDISGQANRYTVGDRGLTATENGATYEGNAIRVRNSRRLTDTGAHEIGHTLGLVHFDYGIMTPSSNDPHRGVNNMPEFIENIISNAIHPTNNGQIGKATIVSPHSLQGYGHVRKIK